jgi:hypothetical protein
MTAPLHQPPHRRGRRTAVFALLALLAALLVPLVGAGSAGAVASPQADAANAWLAGLVAANGSVDGTVPGTPSVNDSVAVALSLSMTGSQPDALARTLGYIQANYGSYVNEGSGDLAGRLGYQIVLAHANGLDPSAFGSPASNLVSRLQALHGSTEAGFYGTPDPFSAVTDQSLAVIGLLAAGAPVPADAVQWLLDQQCTGGTTPAAAAGGWQGYRASSGGVLAGCVDPTMDFHGPDSNSSAVALQALAAAGDSSARSAGLAFLRTLQVATGPAAGGFEFQPTYGSDPNSTALVIQTIVAIGESPTDAGWKVGGASALDALATFVLTSGADAGALEASYAPGANFLATYQGVWGFTRTTFPFLAVTASGPTTTTTTTAPSSSTTGPAAVEAVSAVSVTPAFTG